MNNQLFSRSILTLVASMSLLICLVPKGYGQETIPALYPSNSRFTFVLQDGKLASLLSTSPDPREVWPNPVSPYFLSPGTWNKLDFTNEQIDNIKKMKLERREFMSTLGKKSLEYAAMSRDKNGNQIPGRYQELIRKNLELLKEFNARQEGELKKIVPSHMWTQMGETITRQTFKREGFATQIVKPEFASFLEFSDKQHAELLDTAKKLVKKNDKVLKELAQESIRDLLAVLNQRQKEKLLKAIGAEDFSSLESVSIIGINERLRQFIEVEKAKKNPKAATASPLNGFRTPDQK